MDLYSMIKREDFFALFIPTVKQYFFEVLHKKVEIELTDKCHDCNCVIKPRLSAMMSLHPSRKAKSFFYSEWNIRHSLIKNVLAKLYVWIMTNSGRLFAEYKISIKPEQDYIDDYVIAPNNRTIRIFDYRSGIVGCICKDGFTNKYMKNQIRFRLTHDYDFIQKLIDYGDRWFTEPIMLGHPLARVTDNNLFKAGVEEALRCICLIAKNSLHTVSSHSYCSKLISRIDEFIPQATERKGIKTESEIIRIVSIASKLVLDYPDQALFLSDSHGDLQTGNIWMDDSNKVWIYDWETADTRCIWYDYLVLKYSLRRMGGWKNLFQNISARELGEYINLDKPSVQVITGIVLLEDLLFYFEDMLELPDTWGNTIFDSYVANVANVLMNEKLTGG